MSTAEDNPYRAAAVPETAKTAATDPVALANGVWRDGELLVLRRKRHKLPQLCLICGDPAEGRPLTVRVKRRLDPLLINPLFMLIAPAFYLFGPFFYAVPVEACYCAGHAKQFKFLRAPYLIAAFALALVVVGFIGAMVAVVSKMPLGIIMVLELLVPGGVVLVIGGAMLALMIPGLPIVVKRLDRRFLWLAGVSSPVLEHVPTLQSMTDD